MSAMSIANEKSGDPRPSMSIFGKMKIRRTETKKRYENNNSSRPVAHADFLACLELCTDGKGVGCTCYISGE